MVYGLHYRAKGPHQKIKLLLKSPNSEVTVTHRRFCLFSTEAMLLFCNDLWEGKSSIYTSNCSSLLLIDRNKIPEFMKKKEKCDCDNPQSEEGGFPAVNGSLNHVL